MLGIAPYRDAPLTTSRNERGEQPLGTPLPEKPFPFHFIQLGARGALGGTDRPLRSGCLPARIEPAIREDPEAAKVKKSQR
jgi:hypothetical protein